MRVFIATQLEDVIKSGVETPEEVQRMRTLAEFCRMAASKSKSSKHSDPLFQDLLRLAVGKLLTGRNDDSVLFGVSEVLDYLIARYDAKKGDAGKVSFKHLERRARGENNDDEVEDSDDEVEDSDDEPPMKRRTRRVSDDDESDEPPAKCRKRSNPPRAARGGPVVENDTSDDEVEQFSGSEEGEVEVESASESDDDGNVQIGPNRFLQLSARATSKKEFDAKDTFKVRDGDAKTGDYLKSTEAPFETYLVSGVGVHVDLQTIFITDPGVFKLCTYDMTRDECADELERTDKLGWPKPYWMSLAKGDQYVKYEYPSRSDRKHGLTCAPWIKQRQEDPASLLSLEFLRDLSDRIETADDMWRGPANRLWERFIANTITYGNAGNPVRKAQAAALRQDVRGCGTVVDLPRKKWTRGRCCLCGLQRELATRILNHVGEPLGMAGAHCASRYRATHEAAHLMHSILLKFKQPYAQINKLNVPSLAHLIDNAMQNCVDAAAYCFRPGAPREGRMRSTTAR
jgi:hypothetical protein